MSFYSSGLGTVYKLKACASAEPLSPLVKVVLVLRPLDVDQFLALLLVSFPTRDGKVLHVLQGMPQGFHRFPCYLDHHTVYRRRGEKTKPFL